jgi:hypothetical protein
MRKRTGLTCGRAICGMLMMLAAFPLSAQTENIIYNFSGGSNGSNPTFGFASYKGSLYSTLLHGGGGFGEVYKLTPPATGTTWVKRSLHNFTGQTGDGSPAGHVIADQNGNLWGVAADGVNTCGLIYELSPPAAGQTEWTWSVMHSFNGKTDGCLPSGGLAVDQNGALYGITHVGGGGSCDCGTIFRLSHNLAFGWIFEVLHTFADGDKVTIANGDLLIDNTNGYVFGSTPTGGANGFGKVYYLTPPSGTETEWPLNTIHDFAGTDANDGAGPWGHLAGSTGDIFGTTRSGGASANCCGMIFELREEIAGNPYTLINHHNFTGGQDGATPFGSLYKDSSGNLWGTTVEGGAGTTGSDFGTIYELYPDRIEVGVWHYKVAYSFNGGPNDGEHAEGQVVENSKGVLFGITTNGGQTGNDGVVYGFIP